MRKIIFNVMLITVIAKLLGFARELVLSYFIGANGISDAYLISLTIPGTIFQFVGTGLATCFIPVFFKILKKDGKEKSNEYTNTVLTLILIFSTIVVIVTWIFGDKIVKLFASGFKGETLDYAILFTKINITSIYLSTFIYVFNSFLQANEQFNIVSAVAIPNSIIVLISIILGAKFNYILLPIGSILAVGVQLLFLIPSVKKNGFSLKLNKKFKSKYMKDMYKLIIPVIIGVSVNEINILVDKTIASTVAIGGISALTYANSLIMFVQGLFAQTISTIYYPTITRLIADNDNKKLAQIIEEALIGMLFFLIPITFGCLLLSKNIVIILYGRGAFDDNAINLTIQALIGYAIGTICYGLREIFSRIFYSKHNAKIPTTNAIIGVIINIILNLTLSKYIGIGGLAFATSISSIVTTILLYINLKRQKIYNFSKAVLVTIFKLTIASIIMSIIIWLIQKLNFNIYIITILSIILGILCYVILSSMLGIDYIKQLIRLLFKNQKIIDEK